MNRSDADAVFAPAPEEEVLATRRMARGEITFLDYPQVMHALAEAGELGADVPAAGPADDGRGDWSGWR